jgi:hypothetical protein
MLQINDLKLHELTFEVAKHGLDKNSGYFCELFFFKNHFVKMLLEALVTMTIWTF